MLVIKYYAKIIPLHVITHKNVFCGASMCIINKKITIHSKQNKLTTTWTSHNI